MPSKRIDDFIMLYYKSLSDLENAKIKNIEGKPVDKETNTIIEHYDKVHLCKEMFENIELRALCILQITCEDE